MSGKSVVLEVTYTLQRSPPWPRRHSPAAGRAPHNRQSGAWRGHIAEISCTLQVQPVSTHSQRDHLALPVLDMSQCE